MARLKILFAQIDALTLKERVLILLAAIAVLYAVWHYALMQPLDVKQQRLTAALQQQQRELESLAVQLRLTLEQSRNDPDAANRSKLARLQEKIQKLDDTLAQMTKNLIPPERMAQVLETVLLKSSGLTVVDVRGLGSASLLEALGEAVAPAGAVKSKRDKVKSKPPAPVAAGAYKHGVQITVSGTYFDALHYLRALEALPYAFFWDSLELQVGQYPQATTAIVVYTLSLDPRWIGV